MGYPPEFAAAGCISESPVPSRRSQKVPRDTFPNWPYATTQYATTNDKQWKIRVLDEAPIKENQT